MVKKGQIRHNMRCDSVRSLVLLHDWRRLVVRRVLEVLDTARVLLHGRLCAHLEVLVHLLVMREADAAANPAPAKTASVSVAANARKERTHIQVGTMPADGITHGSAAL